MNAPNPWATENPVADDSIQTYRLARHWRIITYLIAPPLIGVFLYLLAMPFLVESAMVFYFLIPVSIGMIGLFVYGSVDAWVGMVTLSENAVVVKGPFGERALLVGEIKGYSIDENYIHVYATDPKKKKLKVSTYLENSKDIKDWFALRFADLNAQEVVEETRPILQDDRFGITVEARARKLLEARRVAKTFNAVSWVVLVWVMFYPKPYEVAIIVGLLLPMLIMMASYLYRGLMKADENDNSAYPSMATGFGVVAVAVALRALLDFTILQYNTGWYLIASITVILSFLYLLPTDVLKFHKVSDYLFLAVIPLVMFMYAYGITVLGNCMLDRSPALVYETTVLEKTTTKGKSTTYYLTVSPWGTLTEPQRLDVPRSDYESASEGERVTVVQRDGYFGMSWVVVNVP
jgi:hypothetical protein